jgi:drug/metabolite transporter (DMT)-like permease
MKKETIGYISILITAFIFSTMEIALKMVTGIFYPMQITLLRFLIGGIVLIPVAGSALKKRGMSLTGTDLKRFAMLGFFCVLMSMVLYQMAVVNTKASVVAVVFSGNPIFVTILAFLILGEGIYWYNIAALVLEVVGILAIVNPFHAAVSIPGVVLSVLAAVFFALYGVLGKQSSMKFSSIATTCFAFLFGSLELLIVLLLGRIGPVAAFYQAVGLKIFAHVPLITGINLNTLPHLFYICVISSAVGYVCYMMAMEYTSAKQASLVFFIKPMLAPVLALLILHEEITRSMAVAILFFLAGSLFSIVPSLLKERKTAARNGK